MTYRTSIEAKVVVAGLHCWPSAKSKKPDVAYLAEKHRHLFVIRARQLVSHDDRDTEFICLGHQIRQFLSLKFPMEPDGSLDFGRSSCEGIASSLVRALDLKYCSVHEDDENGAIVEASDEDMASPD